MYHSIPRHNDQGRMDAAALDRHLGSLESRFDLVDHRALDRTRRRRDRIQVTLTFDDGLKNHIEVAAPLLRKHRVPAAFFVPTRHASAGRYLWFVYLDALERFYRHDTLAFQGVAWDMRPAARPTTMLALRRALLALRPHPAAMYEAIEQELPALEDFMTAEQIRDRAAGLSGGDIRELASDHLFTIGGHTEDHPILTACGPAEASRQIRQNVEWIEAQTGRRCDAFAYPGGAYDERILDECAAAGFSQAFAIAPRLRSHSRLERPRVGLYDASEEILVFKVQWGALVRKCPVELF
jgi:peptidoglycan/xylan/chitin deacetylase (PgdA/CDA1 family)